jgi:NAD(P)-dependent dehydrogenase (short-subunit alcohol dehydrogenase family)
MTQLTWLVTGCSSGLGEIFVRSILARGDKVVAGTRGHVSRLSALAEAGARTVSLDVTASQSEINAVVGKVLEEGPIDVLVNNAGYVEAGLSEEARYGNIKIPGEEEPFANGIVAMTATWLNSKPTFSALLRRRKQYFRTSAKRSLEL